MKNLILALLLSVSTVTAFANEAKAGKNQQLNEASLKLLFDNVKNVEISGDKDAKLQDMLQDIAEFYASKLSGAMTGSEDDEDIKLNDVKLKCRSVVEYLAVCDIGLDYKGSDFLEISYFVNLKDKKPVGIHNNLVGIRRY